MEETTKVICEQAVSITDFVAPVMTLLAAVIGGFVLWSVHKTNMVRSAKANFISSVYTLFEGIYPENVDQKREIFSKLREAQPGLHRAIAIFRFHIPKKRLSEFDRVWDAYLKFYPECTKEAQTVHAFYGEGESPYKKLCKRLDLLLDFAKI